MTPVELVERIEAAGGVLTLNGENVRCRLPEDVAPLLGELRAHKAQVVALLKNRQQQALTNAIIEAECIFGQPHAKWFPYIGRKIRTPKGPGTLLQVFAERVTVLLDSDLEKCSWFRPEEIKAISDEKNGSAE